MCAVTVMKSDLLAPRKHRTREVLAKHLHTGVPQPDVKEQKDLLKTIPDHLSFLQLGSVAFFTAVFCIAYKNAVSFSLCCP